jgi:iron complex outermembrane receptor protein
VNLGVQGFFNGSTTPVPVLYTVFQPINGDKGYVEGIEFGFQHILPSGFGVHGQFTHTWSKEYIGGQYAGPLEGVAPNTASLGVLYEAGPISANVNWDYDGPKVEQTSTEIEGLSAYQNSFSWVTAQVSYEFFKGLKLYFEGENLANAIPRTYLANRKDEVWASGATTTNLSSDSAGTSSAVGQGYTAFGRTFTLGISYRF